MKNVENAMHVGHFQMKPPGCGQECAKHVRDGLGRRLEVHESG